MMRALPLLVLLLAGCGGSPTAPSPTPSPSPAPPTFTGSVTNTVSGAPVLGFSATITAGRLTVSAPGYLTRETSTGRATVDLIPEAGFDLSFYRQFARGTLEDPMQPLAVLSAQPSIYIQTSGLSASTVNLMIARTRDVVPALTGSRFSAVIETGESFRSPAAGWIMVTLVNAPNETWCGQAFVGSPAGHIQLNISPERQRPDRPGCFRPLYDTLGHELGHALGFWHVDDTAAVMSPMRPLAHSGLVSDRERRHALIAYKRSRGNLDVDVDVDAAGAPLTLGVRTVTRD